MAERFSRAGQGTGRRRGQGAAALAIVLALSFARPALAGPHDSGSGSAEARLVLVERLSFIKTGDLDFGRIVPGATAGTVVLAPDGRRSATGGVTLANGQSQPATFAGYGRFNRLVTIRLGANVINLVRAGGPETMRMDTFIIGSTPTAQLTTAPLAFRIGSQSGMFAFPIGATLRVRANQAPGTYAGSFQVTLDYQ